MRLVCPNCVAQYEVDDSAIPPSGRDVQCAACNHTWFQDAVEMLPTEDMPLQRQQLDPQVRDILRSEAEFSQAARVAEQGETPPVSDSGGDDQTANSPQPETTEPAPTDTTPTPQKPAEPAEDNGAADEDAELAARIRALEEEFEAEVVKPAPPSAPTPTPAVESAEVAKPKKAYRAPENEEPAPLTSAPAKPIARRDRLPDLEEIEDEIEYREDFDDYEDDVVETKKRGFAWGFWGVVLIGLIIIALYIFAKPVAEFFPQIEPFLVSLIEIVDRARITIEEIYGNTLAWLFPTQG